MIPELRPAEMWSILEKLDRNTDYTTPPPSRLDFAAYGFFSESPIGARAWLLVIRRGLSIAEGAAGLAWVGMPPLRKTGGGGGGGRRSELFIHAEDEGCASENEAGGEDLLGAGGDAKDDCDMYC